ncbi:MAG TPA: hypothetical protein VNI83_01690 [Vicinamibacterales bacterium]|nr:hypothetical protein [Vicinamibacterales bacterium]
MTPPAQDLLPLPSPPQGPGMSNLPSGVSPPTPLVLIVDSRPPAWADGLLRSGCRVLLARTAFEGLVKACCLSPDLVLVSRSLPSEADPEGPDRLDSRQLVEFLRRCPLTAHIPTAAFRPEVARRPARVTRLLRDATRRTVAETATAAAAAAVSPAC